MIYLLIKKRVGVPYLNYKRGEDLIKIVRTHEGKVEIDLTSNKNGRGAYLKKDKEVFLKAKSSKILDRILEIDIDNELYDELNSLL